MEKQTKLDCVQLQIIRPTNRLRTAEMMDTGISRLENLRASNIKDKIAAITQGEDQCKNIYKPK